MIKKSNLLKKFISISLSIVISFAFLTPAYTEETVERVFTGIGNVGAILNNIDYRDVKQSNAWSKEAICEVSALEIMKGYGNRTFGRTNSVTKEQVLTMIYNAVGREAEAQIAAELIDEARNAGDKKKYAPAMWSDGYLQLAATDGLISDQDLVDAMALDRSAFTSTSFVRDSAAKRQEVAYWMAKALGLTPVNGQQMIFNNYSDWSQADPLKIPYIEAVLQNNIMSGMGNGSFRPQGNVTREQMAQIIKNALPVIMPLRGYEKELGTIEDISNSMNFADGQNLSKNTYNVRNSNGKLHKLITGTIDNPTNNYRNELNGSLKTGENADVIVYKNGWIGNSSVLEVGDRIEYIVTVDGRVLYVKVISNTADTRYMVARVNAIDTTAQTLNISKVFDIKYPEVDIENENFSYDSDGKDVDVTLVYSSNAEIFADNIKTDIKAIESGMDVILAITDNMITGIKKVTLRLREQGIANGIVEDINPQLGYITLYNEAFKGNGTDSGIMTYNYSNSKNISVVKNYKPAQIEAVEGGDSVYIKFDSEGNIEIISAVDNYIERHGKILSIKPLTLAVQYDDGSEQILMTNADIPVIFNKKLVEYNTLKDGDRVKLLLNTTGTFTHLKQITIEGDEHFVSNIYKGIVVKFDDISNSVILQNMEIFKNGNWKKVEQKGFSNIQLAEDNKLFYNSKNIDADTINSKLRSTEAYIAVEKDYGGDEKAVMITFKDKSDTELIPLDDSIASNTFGIEGVISLQKETDNVLYDKGTIVIKDKRLVNGSSISPEDMAYVIANRKYSDGKYYASVVEINQRFVSDFINIYRGRISSINENRDFTVSSFSQLNGVNWDFYNTPKTFKITSNTSIVDEMGIVGQRDFTDYGEESYKGRTVYILANDTDAIMVNTAPYGTVFAKGEIYKLTGEDKISGFTVMDAKVYNATTFKWEDRDVMDLRILTNSIVLKENRIAKPSDLEIGDKVRIVKKDDSLEGDAYIIFVE